jgi:hypothetical protein
MTIASCSRPPQMRAVEFPFAPVVYPVDPASLAAMRETIR